MSATEGWFGPQGSKRFHYFTDDLRSLCGKWMLWRTPQSVGMEWGAGIGYAATGDCAACAKKLAARGGVAPSGADEPGETP